VRHPANFLRRAPLSRLVLLIALVLIAGSSLTAFALGLGSGPTPPAKPLAEALHDALAGAGGQPIQGVTARIQLTNHLIEGASLAGGGAGGGLASSPLVTGASGRLWIAADGRARLELQSDKGDSQLVYDGHTLSFYDASTNTLYRYTPRQSSAAAGAQGSGDAGSEPSNAGADPHGKVPTAQEIQEAIAKAAPHATFSGATPTDVAGQPAYTVRVSPAHDGGLVAGGELSFDASNGAPLRAAIYSTTSSAPVMELAASEISYGPVESSAVDFTPPAGAKVEEVTLPEEHGSKSTPPPTRGGESPPKVSTHGEGLAGITVIEGQAKSASGKPSASLPEGLPQVKINGVGATELPTALGTLLSFERGSVRYLLVGSVTPAAIESFARGL
jgi:outer membrane lipoprotein-sorting protein